MFQRTVVYTEKYSPGYHVGLDDGKVVMVRWDRSRHGSARQRNESSDEGTGKEFQFTTLGHLSLGCIILQN